MWRNCIIVCSGMRIEREILVKKSLILFGIMFLVTLAGIGITFALKPEVSDEGEDKFTVVTSFYPMYIAAANVLDGIPEMELLNLTENQGGCLHDYQLTTQDMRKLENADILILNGGGMEPFLEEIVKRYPDLMIIDASEGIALLTETEGHSHGHEMDVEALHQESMFSVTDGAEAHNADVHETEEYNTGMHEMEEHNTEVHETKEHAHEHGLENAHVWMSPEKYILQIQNIAKGLAIADPEHETIYQENAVIYNKKVQVLNEDLKKLPVNGLKNGTIIFHDAFAYLADRLGIPVIHSVELEADTSLSAGEVAELIEDVREHNIKYIFTEKQLMESAPKRVAEETGATLCVIDSLVSGTMDKDAYLTGMKKNIEVLEQVLTNE